MANNTQEAEVQEVHPFTQGYMVGDDENGQWYELRATKKSILGSRFLRFAESYADLSKKPEINAKLGRKAITHAMEVLYQHSELKDEFGNVCQDFGNTSSTIGDSIQTMAYIDFEISEGLYERTRTLYERLLDRTKHLKVWLSYADFEAPNMEDKGDDASQESLYEQRKKSLERARATKKLKKRRPIVSDQGHEGLEEYIDYMFPEEPQTTNHKILAAAYAWKKQKTVASDE